MIATAVAGCAASDKPPVAPEPVTANIPAVPADVLACRQLATVTPDRDLTAGEVERLWKTDRARLARVNRCFHRMLCQYADIRRDIGKVENEPVCEGR